MRLVALDEQRHIGFGVKLLHDLARRGRRRCRDAVADLLREVTPYSLAVFIPPELGPLLHRVLRLHARGDLHRGRALLRGQAALRRACRWSRCPARRSSRWSCPRAERAEYGLAMLRAGFLGPPQRRAAARPGGDGAAVRRRSRAPSTTAPRRRARSPCSGSSPDAEPWHVRVDNGSTAAAAGPRAAGRRRAALPLRGLGRRRRRPPRPARALATGRLRPHGSPRALWAARGLF